MSTVLHSWQSKWKFYHYSFQNGGHKLHFHNVLYLARSVPWLRPTIFNIEFLFFVHPLCSNVETAMWVGIMISSIEALSIFIHFPMLICWCSSQNLTQMCVNAMLTTRTGSFKSIRVWSLHKHCLLYAFVRVILSLSLQNAPLSLPHLQLLIVTHHTVGSLHLQLCWLEPRSKKDI